ncbi:hypothetical protein [Streptomyces sp. NPDC004014]
MAFMPTEVNGAYEGPGIGGPLVRFSLDAARAAGFPCPLSVPSPGGGSPGTQNTEIRDIT